MIDYPRWQLKKHSTSGRSCSPHCGMVSFDPLDPMQAGLNLTIRLRLKYLVHSWWIDLLEGCQPLRCVWSPGGTLLNHGYLSSSVASAFFWVDIVFAIVDQQRRYMLGLFHCTIWCPTNAASHTSPCLPPLCQAHQILFAWEIYLWRGQNMVEKASFHRMWEKFPLQSWYNLLKLWLKLPK